MSFGWSSVGTDVRLAECPVPWRLSSLSKDWEPLLGLCGAGLCTKINAQLGVGGMQMRCKLLTLAGEAWATGAEVGDRPESYSGTSERCQLPDEGAPRGWGC